MPKKQEPSSLPGAGITNLLVKVFLKRFLNPDTGEISRITENYGYVLFGFPCPTCERETNEVKMHPKDWEYTCPACANYVKFMNVKWYLDAFKLKTRDWEELRISEIEKYHYKDRYRIPISETSVKVSNDKT